MPISIYLVFYFYFFGVFKVLYVVRGEWYLVMAFSIGSHVTEIDPPVMLLFLDEFKNDSCKKGQKDKDYETAIRLVNGM